MCYTTGLQLSPFKIPERKLEEVKKTFGKILSFLIESYYVRHIEDLICQDKIITMLKKIPVKTSPLLCADFFLID